MLYIDPGTGSMLFTILIGLMSTGAYKSKDLILKAKLRAGGGRVKVDRDHIDFVIYSDHKRYWNVFEPVCDEFEKRGVEIVYMTSSEDDPAMDKAYDHVRCEFIGEGNRAFARLNRLKADILLSTTPSLDVFNWKRSHNVKYYVHIPHAPSDLTLYRMFGIDFYDAILTSGDYHEDQIRALEKVRDLPEKEIVKTGLTYLDTMKARLDREGTGKGNETTVLLAPSWGPNGILSRYGSRMIDALLDTGHRIIIRPHPQSFTSEKELMDDLMSRYPESDRLSWNRDNDNFDVLRESDIMISDFSGVIFDFVLVFDKPVIYTGAEFDTAAYDACWLDETPWTFRVLPSIGAKLEDEDIPNIGELIDRCLQDPSFTEGRGKSREETWSHMGESATLVTDYMIDKRKELGEDGEDKTEIQQ